MAPVARCSLSSALLLLAASAAAHVLPITTGTVTTPAPTPSVTAVSKCHAHEDKIFCMGGTKEYELVGGPTKTEELDAQYTGCHAHGTETMCMDSHGDHVEIRAEEHAEEEEEHAEEEEEHGHDHSEESKEEPDGEHCHFHSGVEHCVKPGEEKQIPASCKDRKRDYNIPLRVGLLFVILVTGGLGVYLPIVAASFTRMSQKSILFVILKQFGTGVVLSTAFIHLYTHGHLMFTSECLQGISYESTNAAVFLAGVFLSFLVDYLGSRFILWRRGQHSHSHSHSHDAAGENTLAGDSKDVDRTPNSSAVSMQHDDDHSSHVNIHNAAEETVAVWVLEAGVIFHSLLIGLTLVVAGDSFFLTLFAVIIFHQMFEGIALGTCIAGLPTSQATLVQKMVMAGAFTLITPIGMAIGIGVLKNFNGNSREVLIAFGTLDAMSAGILAWVGIVEMLAKDWMHGPLLTASKARTAVAMFSFLAGIILMSFLGKWT